MLIGNRKYWLFQLVGWGSLGMVNSFFAFSYGHLNSEFFQRLGVFLLPGVIFSHLMRVVFVWLGLVQKSLNKQVPLFLIITFCFTVVGFFTFVVSCASVALLTKLGLLNKGESELLARIDLNYWSSKLLLVLSTAFSYFLLFIVWSLLYFVYHYVTNNSKQRLETLPLDSLAKA